MGGTLRVGGPAALTEANTVLHCRRRWRGRAARTPLQQRRCCQHQQTRCHCAQPGARGRLSDQAVVQGLAVGLDLDLQARQCKG